MDEQKWFGVVRWCDEDIADALENCGHDKCIENIAKIRDKCMSHWFQDAMVETGWDYIYAYISESEADLK